jgi:hypothetical protein
MSALTTLITNLVYVVPVVALVLVWWGGKLDAGGEKRWVTGLWIGMAALAMLHYVWPHVRNQRYFNGYEHFHYYLGTKYAHELGYTGLYVATIAALDENQAEQGGEPLKLERVRDLQTGGLLRPDRARRDIPDVKARFSAARWAEYRLDAAYLAKRTTRGGTQKALEDKGYNASPAWTLVSGALSNATSTVTGSIELLPWLDVLLWLIAFIAIGRVYGARVLSVVLVLLGTQLVTDHAHLKAAFLRVDWIACLLLAMVAQKKRQPFVAGALVGYAAMMRVFPAVFAFGVGVKLVSVLWRHRRIDQASVRFLVGMSAAMLVLFAASAGLYGLDYWREFFEKIVPHANSITSWRVGFRTLFLGLGALGGWQELLNSHSAIFYALCVVILIACAFVVEKIEDADDALAFGFFAFYVLMAPTYYYYVALLVPVLWFGKRLELLWAKVGLTMLLVIGLAMHALMALFDRGAAVFAPLSVVCLVLFVYVTLALRREQRSSSRASEAPSLLS